MTVSDWSEYVARASHGIETDVERLEHAMKDRAGILFVRSEIGGLILAHYKLGRLIEQMTEKEAA